MTEKVTAEVTTTEVRHKIGVLDHGYVELVDTWGSEERIVEAARMSTGKGFLGWGGARCLACEDAGRLSPDGLYRTYEHNNEAIAARCACGGTGKIAGDEKLLRFLWEHEHRTPFEMAGMTIEVQAPIFVFREWHRHRTQSYNEMSARYAPLPDVNYVPTVERLMINAKTGNKQAGTVGGADELTEATARKFQDELRIIYHQAQSLYAGALVAGVPKELARVHLPVGRYSRMRASANLRNWLAFLTLRMDAAAQFEIRAFANAVGTLVAEKFPRTWALFRGEKGG